MSSTEDTFINRPATLADYLAILRRRKWIIISVPIIAAVVAYAASARQSPLYKASAQVRFDTTDIVAAVTGISAGSVFGDPTRFLATQSNVARDPQLAERVAEKAGVPGMTADSFLAESSANARTDADILDFSVTDPGADAATRLANTYAREFTAYKTELQTAKVNATLAKVEKTLKPLRATGATTTPQFLTLSQYESQLKAVGDALASNTRAQPAEGASQVRPHPKRNAILGGLLGLLFGIGLALLAEALDKRVRSEKEVEEALGLPLLGRLPSPSRRLRRKNNLVMLAEPRSVHAETYKRLRTTLEFVNYDRSARTIMTTSAGSREGKSTTVANLGVAFARAGRRVVVVDLDLRRPSLHSFFGVRGDSGFTDVVVDRIELEQALRPIMVPARTDLSVAGRNNGRPLVRGDGAASNGLSDTEGVLHLLPCGAIPPAADEFLEHERVGVVVGELANRFDLVLIDAPPLLAVGDAMALSTKVDALLVVSRLGIHRRQLQELARQLQNCRAEILGFIVAGVSHGDSYAYGYGYDPHVYDARREPDRRRERI